MMSVDLGRGPGNSISGLDDVDISEIIQERLPENTYTSIDVETIMYQFSGCNEKVKTRKITLCRGNIDIFFQGIAALFRRIFGDEVKEVQRYYPTPIPNGTKIKKQLLTADQTVGHADIQKCYLKCTKIELYVSDDCNYAHCDQIESKFIAFMAAKPKNKINKPNDETK